MTLLQCAPPPPPHTHPFPARSLRVYLDRLLKTVSQVMADGPIHLPLSGLLTNPHCSWDRPHVPERAALLFQQPLNCYGPKKKTKNQKPRSASCARSHGNDNSFNPPHTQSTEESAPQSRALRWNLSPSFTVCHLNVTGYT